MSQREPKVGPKVAQGAPRPRDQLYKQTPAQPPEWPLCYSMSKVGKGLSHLCAPTTWNLYMFVLISTFPGVADVQSTET